MLASQAARSAPEQLFSDTPDVLGDALMDGVNLTVWQRKLPLHVAHFAQTLLRLGEPLAESITLDIQTGEVRLPTLATAYRDLAGHDGFVADVEWLATAFACLLDARRIGIRLRALDKAMCPRFHVDHVPLRLITTYAGAGSEWLPERAMPRHRLGDPTAEPQDRRNIKQLLAGEVALFKGKKWAGNEGAGIIHRSPDVAAESRRLILTLDWLA